VLIEQAFTWRCDFDPKAKDLSIEIVCLIKKAINQGHLELREGAAENLFMACLGRE